MLIEVNFYVIQKVKFFLAKGVFEGRKQIVVGRRVGSVGRNVPIERKGLFLTTLKNTADNSTKGRQQ